MTVYVTQEWIDDAPILAVDYVTDLVAKGFEMSKKKVAPVKAEAEIEPEPELEAAPEVAEPETPAAEPAAERLPAVGDAVLYTTIGGNQWKATIAERFGVFSNLTLDGAVTPDGGTVEMVAYDAAGAPGTWRWE